MLLCCCLKNVLMLEGCNVIAGHRFVVRLLEEMVNRTNWLIG